MLVKVKGHSFDCREELKKIGCKWSYKDGHWSIRNPSRKQSEELDKLSKVHQIEFDVDGEQAPSLLAVNTLDIVDGRSIAIRIPRGITPYPYQYEGTRFLLDRQYALLADEMGLGKTGQSLLALESLVFAGHLKKCLVIAPTSVLGHWKKELERWAPSAAACTELLGWGAMSSKSVKPHAVDLLIVDECHYAKNPTTIRGKNLAKFAEQAKRIYLLSGTPFINRPIELFALLRLMYHPLANNWEKFVTRYCDGYKDRFGWRTGGASYLDELREKISDCFIRRCKRDVLLDLPDKQRTLFSLESDNKSLERLLLAELYHSDDTGDKDVDKALKGYREKVNLQQMESCGAEFGSLAEVRKELAVEKVRLLTLHVKDLLETTEKVVIFWHHKEPLAQTAATLKEYKCVCVTGDMTAEERQKSIDAFQTGDARVILLTFGAGAEGITLTSANVVVMGECIWTPGKMLQAEDRCHRIGQKDNVQIHYLLWNGSIDAMIAKVACDKAFNINVVFKGDRFEL